MSGCQDAGLNYTGDAIVPCTIQQCTKSQFFRQTPVFKMATPSEVIEIIGEEDYELVFLRGQNEKYSDDEKCRLAKLTLRYEKEQEEAKPGSRLKKQGYVARACRDFYSDLKFVKHDDPQLDKAIKMAKRAVKRVREDPAELEITNSKRRFRAAGGGRKVIFPEVRAQAFEWYVNVR